MSYFAIYMCLRIVVSNTYCGVFFALFVFGLWSVSLDCPFWIATSIFSLYIQMICLLYCLSLKF